MSYQWPHQQRHATGQPVAAVLRFVRLRADARAASAGTGRHRLRQPPVHHDPGQVAEDRCAGEDQREKGLVVVLRVLPPCADLRADPDQPAKTSAMAGARVASASQLHSIEPARDIAEGELRLPVGPDTKTASATVRFTPSRPDWDVRSTHWRPRRGATCRWPLMSTRSLSPGP